jgi:hypothetical protein
MSIVLLRWNRSASSITLLSFGFGFGWVISGGGISTGLLTSFIPQSAHEPAQEITYRPYPPRVTGEQIPITTRVRYRNWVLL